MKRLYTSGFVAFYLGCSGFAVAADVQSEAATAPNTEIRIQEFADDWRLSARLASVAEVFEVIERSTGTRFVYPSLPKGALTLSCRGSVVELTRCVLGSSGNFLIRYGDSRKDGNYSTAPEEIRVLDFEEQSYEVAAQSEGTCGASRSDSEQPAEEDSLADETLSRPGRESLGEAADAREVGTRIEAITRLAHAENDVEDLNVLWEAFEDRNPAVRAQAVSSLIASEAPGSEQILRQALSDENAEVRLKAVGQVEADEDLLLGALEDADPNVRVLAQLKLKHLQNQAALTEP